MGNRPTSPPRSSHSATPRLQFSGHCLCLSQLPNQHQILGLQGALGRLCGAGSKGVGWRDRCHPTSHSGGMLAESGVMRPGLRSPLGPTLTLNHSGVQKVGIESSLQDCREFWGWFPTEGAPSATQGVPQQEGLMAATPAHHDVFHGEVA